MNTLRRCLPALVLLALAVGIAGCSSASRRLSGMGVGVAAFQPTDPAHPENGGTLTLQFTNESIAALGIDRSTHRLSLEGTEVARFANDRAVGIPPMNASLREVAVTFEKPDVVRRLAAGPVRYRLDSVLFQILGEDRTETKTLVEGTVDLRGAPAAAK